MNLFKGLFGVRKEFKENSAKVTPPCTECNNRRNPRSNGTYNPGHVCYAYERQPAPGTKNYTNGEQKYLPNPEFDLDAEQGKTFSDPHPDVELVRKGPYCPHYSPEIYYNRFD